MFSKGFTHYQRQGPSSGSGGYAGYPVAIDDPVLGIPTPESVAAWADYHRAQESIVSIPTPTSRPQMRVTVYVLTAAMNLNGGTCWPWPRYRDPLGYGLTTWGKTKKAAHALAWSFIHGDIPAGMTLDHLCRNPGCVNPSHLELVTKAENSRRGLSRFARHHRSAWQARKRKAG